MSLEEFMQLGYDKFTIANILRAVLLAAICFIVISLVLKAIDRAFKKIETQKSLQGFIRTTIKVVLLFVAVLIVAGSLDIPVASLVALLSVAGLAISLAVQNMLSNVAGGLQILSTKPYRVGEYIEAGGVSGTVIEIGVVYTKMKTMDNKLIFIPNSEISSAKIINYTSEESRRVDLEIAVSYNSSVTLVKKTIEKVIAEHGKIFFTPEPLVRINAYQDSSIQFIVRVWCGTDDYWDVKFDLLEQIKAAFDEVGIEMTYNHLNVHIIQGDTQSMSG